MSVIGTTIRIRGEIVLEPVRDVLARLDAVREMLPVPALVDFYLNNPEAIDRTLTVHSPKYKRCLMCQTRYPCQYAEWAKAIRDALPKR